jgi:flavin reductase (DIM6/NTAB) family NADH-FMN oxidoreductase RutF
MFYEPGKTDHGLPHDPFKSCVVPRPIGWISTRSKDGVDNLAPYSQFTNLSFDPPMVMFSANQTSTGRRKDSVVNAEETGVFGWNMATHALREAVNASAEEVPPGIDEFARAGLEKLEATRIPVPLVAASPVRFECRLLQTTRLPGNGVMGSVDVVMAEVVGVHIDEAALTEDGKVDVLKLRPIARMGYFDYTSVTEVFQMIIPGDDRLLVGLEGAARAHSGTP